MSYKTPFQTKNNRIGKSIIAMLIVGAGSFAGQAAASGCKGLENNTCSANASCSWVDSYERKDGRKVNAFCRTKPGSKTSNNQKLSSKKSASSQKLTNKVSNKTDSVKLATGS